MSVTDATQTVAPADDADLDESGLPDAEPDLANTGQRDWARLTPLSLIAIAVGFNLVVLRAATRTVANLNDTSVHISMVQWAADRLSQGKLVFDGWYPSLSMGLPQFHHYQSLPHIVAGVFVAVTGVGAATAVNWSYYLLLALWPVCIYWAARLFGFDRWTAATTGLLAPLVVSVTGYGYEYGSYLWRGNGVWSQLWGMWLLPLAIAFTWRAVSRGKGYALAALFLGLTIACHFLTGYVGILLLGVWVLLVPREFIRRAGRAVIVGVGAALVAAWVIVPLLVDSKWSARTEANVGLFWSNSYGGKKVMTWLVTGQLFDHGRWPVLSVLAAVGVVVCVCRFRSDERSRALLGVMVIGLLLFCGRDTIGFALNLLPGNKDLLLHRFIIPVHLAGIMLAGVGASWLAQALWRVLHRWQPRVPGPAIAVVLVVMGLVVIAPAWTERAHFTAVNSRWVNVQRTVDAGEGQDFTALADQATALGGGRLYAGLASAGGGNIRVGSVAGFSYLLDDDTDAFGFTLRTLSLSSDVETRFDDTDLAQYDLFDIRYLLLPAGRPPPVPATFLSSRGAWRLWSVQTGGYLRVVDTTTAITADRTNLGSRTAAFVRSAQPAEGLIPVVAFGGSPAAQPTQPSAAPAGNAGQVSVQYDVPGDGTFGGEITANRQAVVMLKATYDPRWKATVDGKPAKTQMLAPSFVGVEVGPGQHRIEFRYQPYPDYLLLFAIGALALIALAVVPRHGHRARRLLKRQNQP